MGQRWLLVKHEMDKECPTVRELAKSFDRTNMSTEWKRVVVQFLKFVHHSDGFASYQKPAQRLEGKCVHQYQPR